MSTKRSCDRCHQLKTACRGGYPCERCLKTSIDCLFERPEVPIGRRRKSTSKTKKTTYSHSGCFTCKKRKKKCDEQWPVCNACARLLLQCERPEKFELEPEIPVSSDELSADFLISSSTELTTKERMFLSSLMEDPSIPLDDMSVSSAENDRYLEEKDDLLQMCQLPTLEIPVKERELLVFFISEVSLLLFADKTTNKFLNTVVPLCLIDARVRYPIIAIAASISSGSTRDSVVYKARAHTCLIGAYDEMSENVLLSVLLTCVLEIFEGNSLYWSMALAKAATMIHKQGGFKTVSKVTPLSIQLFCYLDLISSLSTCSAPFLERGDDLYSEYDSDHIGSLLNTKFGFKFGIAGEIYKIIGNISTLASLRLSRSESAEREKQFNLLANLIEMKLQNWSLPCTDGASKLILSSYALALQWSAFLRLHQIRYGYNRRDARVEAILDLILRSIKTVEADPDLEASLIFPLVMSGSVSYKQHDREYIILRVRAIKKRLKFNYVGEFEKLLERVWSRDGHEGDAVNWAKIRYYEFPGLVMF